MTIRELYIPLCGILLFTAAICFPFVYQDTFGERDTYRMAIGILDAVFNDKNLQSTFLYNLDNSYGYYAFIGLFERIIQSEPTAIIPIMNYTNAASALLTTIPFFLLIYKFWGTTAAIAANVLLALIPSWHNLSLYGHPMMEACLFFMLGLCLIIHQPESKSQNLIDGKKLTGAAALASLTLALTFRLDVILAFPAIPAALMLSQIPARVALIRVIVYCLMPLAIFFACQSFLPERQSEASSQSTVDLLLQWHNPSRFAANILQGTVNFMQAMNPILLVAYSLSSIYLFMKKRYLALLFVVPVPAINYLFWIPNPYPPRHYFYAAPFLAAGIAIGLSEYTLQFQWSRLRNQLAITGTTGFLIAASLLGATLYRSEPPFTPADAHRRTKLGSALQQLAPQEEQILVVADANPVIFQMLLTDHKLHASSLLSGNVFAFGNIIELSGDRNRFIFFEQGWKGAEISSFLKESVAEFGSGALLLIDPFNPIIKFDSAAWRERFNIMRVPSLE